MQVRHTTTDVIYKIEYQIYLLIWSIWS